MVKVEFEYLDEYCLDGKWRKQSCECNSVAECIEFYGLGVDCEYRILSVEEI